MKTINKISILGLIICMMMTTACEPVIDNPHKLTGEVLPVPSNFTLTAVVNDFNDVIVTFTRMGDIVDGKNIIGFHIYSPEIDGWSFQTSYNSGFQPNATSMPARRVFEGGTYTIRAEAISSAGTGPDVLAATFTVPAPTLLREITADFFTEAAGATKVEVGGETYYRRLVYVSNAAHATNQAQNHREITLRGDFASWDMVFNLDFFERINVNTVRWRGLINFFNLYYDPVRKHVFVDPPTNGEIVNANYQILSGTGLGRPTSVSHADIVTAGSPNGRFNVNNATTSTAFQDRIVMWRVGNAGNNYQATVAIRNDAAFRVFDNTGRGGQRNFAWECVFIRTAGFLNIINHGRDQWNEWPLPAAQRQEWWSPWNPTTITQNLPDITASTARSIVDETALYRITFNRSNREVRIIPVDHRGRILTVDGDLREFEASIAFSGITINTQGRLLARADISFPAGVMVRSARVALVPGDVTATLDAVAAGIIAGTTTFTNIPTPNPAGIPANRTLEFAFTDPGVYSLVIVTYDGFGVPQSWFMDKFEYPIPPPTP